jgi:hypothetical protein
MPASRYPPHQMSGKRASIWLFHAPPRRRITGRPPTPRTGPLAGRRIRRRPSRCLIRPCGPGSSGTPAALTAASIPTSGSRPVRKQARPATRRPRRLPSASPALYARSAWNYRCGLGISASTVSGAVWSPPTARHCAAGCTRAQSVRCRGHEGPGREHDPRRPAERARRSDVRGVEEATSSSVIANAERISAFSRVARRCRPAAGCARRVLTGSRSTVHQGMAAVLENLPRASGWAARPGIRPPTGARSASTSTGSSSA